MAIRPQDFDRPSPPAISMIDDAGLELDEIFCKIERGRASATQGSFFLRNDGGLTTSLQLSSSKHWIKFVGGTFALRPGEARRFHYDLTYDPVLEGDPRAQLSVSATRDDLAWPTVFGIPIRVQLVAPAAEPALLPLPVELAAAALLSGFVTGIFPLTWIGWFDSPIVSTRASVAFAVLLSFALLLKGCREIWKWQWGVVLIFSLVAGRISLEVAFRPLILLTSLTNTDVMILGILTGGSYALVVMLGLAVFDGSMRRPKVIARVATAGATAGLLVAIIFNAGVLPRSAIPEGLGIIGQALIIVAISYELLRQSSPGHAGAANGFTASIKVPLTLGAFALMAGFLTGIFSVFPDIRVDPALYRAVPGCNLGPYHDCGSLDDWAPIRTVLTFGLVIACGHWRAGNGEARKLLALCGVVIVAGLSAIYVGFVGGSAASSKPPFDFVAAGMIGGLWYALATAIGIAVYDSNMRRWKIIVGIALTGAIVGFLLPIAVDPLVIHQAANPSGPGNLGPIPRLSEGPPRASIRLPLLIVIWQAALGAAVGYALSRRARP